MLHASNAHVMQPLAHISLVVLLHLFLGSTIWFVEHTHLLGAITYITSRAMRPTHFCATYMYIFSCDTTSVCYGSSVSSCLHGLEYTAWQKLRLGIFMCVGRAVISRMF